MCPNTTFMRTHPNQKGLDQKIESVFQKIFALEKRRKLGLFGMVAHYAYEQNKKELHIKELKEQIFTCRENMQEVYGQKIIKEIEELPVKFRKFKRRKLNSTETFESK